MKVAETTSAKAKHGRSLERNSIKHFIGGWQKRLSTPNLQNVYGQSELDEVRMNIADFHSFGGQLIG